MTSNKDDAKSHAIVVKFDKLLKRSIELSAFNPAVVQQQFDPAVAALENSILRTLREVFGADSQDYHDFKSAGNLDDGILYMDGRSMPLGELRERLTKNKASAEITMSAALAYLAEQSEYASTTPLAMAATSAPVVKSKPTSMFLVHGHDAALREAVARFVEQLGIKVLILGEQANQGKTIIEKFEANSGGVGYAICLFSPDDVGGKKGEQLKDRARQNVVLETGYFIGKLGRDKVCKIVRGDLDPPSDLHGVVHINFDTSPWQLELGKELDAAGFDIDWNKHMKRTSQ
jgi:predicted nucleotide-binding protein